jgi:hypothetical protein
MATVVLEDMVPGREWGKEGMDRDWGRETDMGMAVGVDRAEDNKETVEPGYRMESSDHCCNQLVSPCYS